MKIFICGLSLLSLICFLAFGVKDPVLVDSRMLDANAISTWFRSNGSFNRDPATGNAGFYFQMHTARYASGLWIGAKVGNDTNVTVCGFEYEYLPGYTDSAGLPQGFNDPNYRIYKLTRGINDNDRLNWPNSILGNSNQGAPVYFDTLTQAWKPLDFGNQTMFYNYTDAYPNSHNAVNGSTAPLKADVKQLNFALASTNELHHIIFSQFIIINRSSSVWQNAFFAFWTDDDVGAAEDDLSGCDSSMKLGYQYNSNNNDPQYGASPPAVGTVLLKGALNYTGNQNDVVSFCYNDKRIVKTGYKDVGMYSYNTHAFTANHIQSYRVLNGLRSDGTSIIHPSGYTTRYFFSGDPVTVTGWINTAPANRGFIMSTGPVNVSPSDTQVIILAQVIGRGTNNINSISVLRNVANMAKEFYSDCYNFSPTGILSQQAGTLDYFLEQNYPNPFNPVTTISFVLPVRENVVISIYDLNGREIRKLWNGIMSPGHHKVNFDGSEVPSGVYFYKISAGNFEGKGKMVMVK